MDNVGNAMLNVLIIDDDLDIRFGLNRVLTRCSHTVVEAESGKQGLDALAREPFDLVFCDLRFPIGLSGEDTLRAILATHPMVKVVMMSCSMDLTEQQKLTSLGASDAVQKPFFKAQCIETVDKLFQRKERKVA